MFNIEIRNENMKEVEHCKRCGALINAIYNEGLSGIESLPYPCLFKADNGNRYLLQCIIESYRERGHCYQKPIIVSEGKLEHYNTSYAPENYELKDFVISSDTNVYLVHGEAGIGKSTFINELYLEVALYALKNGKNILPIMLRGEKFGSDSLSPEEWMMKQLSEKYKYLDFEPAFFEPNLNVVFFLDAINDIQYTDYLDFQNKLSAWQKFIEEAFYKYNNIKFIISSRYLEDLENFEIKNYTKLFIHPFDDMQIKSFIDSYNLSNNDKKQIKNIVKDNNDLPFLKNPFFLEKLMSTHSGEIKNRTDIINTFLDSIFSRKNWFMGKRRTVKNINKFRYFDINLNSTTFLDALSKIAFENQKHNKLEVTTDEINQIVHQDTKQFINFAKDNSIFAKKSLKFTHPILQEYFAARYMFSHLSIHYNIYDLTIIEDETRLIQTLKHLYNLLDDKEKFIDLLLTNKKFVLAAECILEDMNEKLKNKVVNEIAHYLSECADSLHKVNNLGFLLGKLGDPRIFQGEYSKGFIEPKVVNVASIANLKVGIYPVTNLEFSYFINDEGYSNNVYWEGMASLNWLDFETRVKSICDFWYKIQDKLNSDSKRYINFCMENNFDKELIAHLSFFKAIPKDEFEIMIRDLYSEERSKKPLMWEVPTYNNPSQPVVGISIYEALAYCSWLSKKTQKKYRLLTNQEWELIAGANSKAYIYGNTIDIKISNTSETKLKKVIPVGICRYNVSKDGIYDLTGNIFEWTSSIYGNEEENLFKQYICKGGSWIQDASRAKSNYIGRGMGWVRNLDVGFRVCYDEN